MSKCLLILSCISVLFTGNVCAQEPRAGQFSIEPYKFKAYDGREAAAEFGRLWVREKRHGKSTRLIQLAFVRLKSTAPTPGSPIVFLRAAPEFRESAWDKCRFISICGAGCAKLAM